MISISSTYNFELSTIDLFTNDILFKIKIKDSDICTMCNLEVGSNYHMLLTCSKVTTLWQEVENWIRSLGMTDYHLTERRKIIGDLKNSCQINIIILNTKKTIFQSKRDGGEPTLYQVKANVKQCNLHDEYKFTIDNKEYLFGKKWSSFQKIYNK